MVMPPEGDNNATNEGCSKPARADRAPSSKSIEVSFRVGLVAVSLVCWGVFLADEAPRQRPERSAADARTAASAFDTYSTHAARTFERFAVNVLVYPLIDDTQPPRWTRSGTDWICDGRGEVTIDGRPLIEGEPVPVGEFRVRWNLEPCMPVAGADLFIEGEVELSVSHDGSTVNGHVASPSRTPWVETAGGRLPLSVVTDSGNDVLRNHAGAVR
jgi:hypothetical protein